LRQRNPRELRASTRISAMPRMKAMSRSCSSVCGRTVGGWRIVESFGSQGRRPACRTSAVLADKVERVADRRRVAQAVEVDVPGGCVEDRVGSSVSAVAVDG